jgi:hypothetical protein
MRVRVSVSVVVVVVSSSTVDELVIEPGVLVVVVVVFVDVLPEMLAVSSVTVPLLEVMLSSVTVVELWVRVASGAGGFSTLAVQTGSVLVVVTVVCSVLGVRVE